MKEESSVLHSSGFDSLAGTRRWKAGLVLDSPACVRFGGDRGIKGASVRSPASSGAAIGI